MGAEFPNKNENEQEREKTMMPYGYETNRIYQYPERDGIFNEAVMNFIKDNIDNLLPVKTRTIDLLRKAGCLKTNLGGWPQVFDIEVDVPEGFYRVRDVWADTHEIDNTSDTFRYFDTAYGTISQQPGNSNWTPRRPDIEHRGSRRIFYDYSFYMFRHAINKFERMRLQNKFNQWVEKNMRGRIDAYFTALNRELWKNGVAPGERYERDNTGSSGEDQSLGSIPFYINGLGFRIGAYLDSPATVPNTEQTIARSAGWYLTFHNGVISVPRSERVYNLATGGILFSNNAVFFHPRATDSFSNNRFFHHHTIGALDRGYLNDSRSPFSSTNGLLRHGTNLGLDDATVDVQQMGFRAPYWGLITAYLLSPQWSHASPTGQLSHLSSDLDNSVNIYRQLLLYRENRLPAIIAPVRDEPGIANVPAAMRYPIYKLNETSNPWFNPQFGSNARTDTRAPVSAQIIEPLYYNLSANHGGVTSPKVFWTRPDIQASMNIKAMTNRTFFQDRAKFGPVDFGMDVERYKDMVIYSDLIVPEGVAYLGVMDDDTLQFAFDTTQFKPEVIPLPKAVTYYQGFFAMKLMMINPVKWGILWGIKP